MRLRKKSRGKSNLIGERVEIIRKKRGIKQKELLAQLQVNGIDMNASALSKLEGQTRPVSDIELVAIAGILNIEINILLGIKDY